MTLHPCMGESRTHVNFGVVNKLLVPVLLGTTNMDKFAKSIQPTERKIVPHHSPQVPILAVHEAESDVKKNNTKTRQKDEKKLAQLLTHIM